MHKNKYEFEFGGDFLQKNKNKDKGKVSPRQSVGLDMGSVPLIEMLGNRRITLEGSTGILLYESDNIKINTNKMVVSFFGRGLCVRCISSSCVEIEGFVGKIEFLT